MPSLPKQSRGEPSRVLKRWAQDLTVPAGLLAGNKFVLPKWQTDFIKGAMAPDIREAGLSVARKNGKSGLIALLLLCHLVGPLRRNGWRGLVVSLTGRLAMELWRAMQEIADVNDLPVDFRVTPQPGMCRGADDTRVDFLAADRATGHGSGADIALLDEAGLMPEKSRDLWNAMISSVSGRDGRLIAISIKGDSPMFAELEARKSLVSTHWTEYAADPLLPLDSDKAWKQANPGLKTGIKSRQYMADMAARALASPANQAAFRAYDLNLPQSPSREVICTVHDWKQCLVDELPPRSGYCYVGLDLGSGTSMTAAVMYWPQTHRLEVTGAFPSIPSLLERGRTDGVGSLYQQMFDRGELTIHRGRITNVIGFIQRLADSLAGESVRLGCDRWRKSETMQALDSAGVRWQVKWRGTGASATADGSHDVRSFQRLILGGRVKSVRSLMLESAIANSSIARDSSGNPKLAKDKQAGRIDALAAAVIACGLSELNKQVESPSSYHGVI